MSADPIPSEALVLLAQQGDIEAFTMLYEKHLTPVYKRVCYLVPREDVEDVTQDVFIAVIKSMKKFRGDSKFSTWLRTLTNRRIADYHRSKKPYSKVSIDTDDERHQALENPDADYKSLDDFITLRQALIELPENYREILLLRFVDGLQFSEIASQIEISLEAAKSRYRRAIAALRTGMQNIHE